MLYENGSSEECLGKIIEECYKREDGINATKISQKELIWSKILFLFRIMLMNV